MMNIWIIGASSGIGSELANQYAELGHDVWISARNEEALKQASERDSKLHPLAIDVTILSSIEKAVNELSSLNIGFDKIIINAGTCEYIDSYSIEIDKIRRVMETNFFGAVNVSHYALSLLRSSMHEHGIQGPQLVFVGSSVTYQALPRAGAYGASKAAERYFAESLRADLALEGIDVRVVSPGFVKTPLTDLNDFPMPFIMEANDAAKCIVKGLSSNNFDTHFPKRFTLLLKLLSILPDVIKSKLLSKASRHDTNKVSTHG